jgi:hypothetical protein
MVTPAALSCRAQSAALPRSVDVDHWPCVTALGIVLNPGPFSTWTRPPSWSVATSIRTVEPRTGDASALARSLTRFTAAVPADVCPIKMTAPVLPCVIAADSAAVGPEVLTALMNSCPTRWAWDIASIVRSTQLAGDFFVVVVEAGSGAAGGVRVVVRGDDGEVAAGALLVVLATGEPVDGAGRDAGIVSSPLPQAAVVISRPSTRQARRRARRARAEYGRGWAAASATGAVGWRNGGTSHLISGSDRAGRADSTGSTGSTAQASARQRHEGNFEPLRSLPHETSVISCDRKNPP